MGTDRKLPGSDGGANDHSSLHGHKDWDPTEVDTLQLRRLDATQRTTLDMPQLERGDGPITSRIDFLNAVADTIDTLFPYMVGSALDIFGNLYEANTVLKDSDSVATAEMADRGFRTLGVVGDLMNRVVKATREYTSQFRAGALTLIPNEETSVPVTVSTEYRDDPILNITPDRTPQGMQAVQKVNPRKFELIVASTLSERNYQDGASVAMLFDLAKDFGGRLTLGQLTEEDSIRVGETKTLEISTAIRAVERVLQAHAADAGHMLPLATFTDGTGRKIRILDLARIGSDGHIISTS